MFLRFGGEQFIETLKVAVYLFIIANNPTNFIVLNGPTCGGIMFNILVAESV